MNSSAQEQRAAPRKDSLDAWLIAMQEARLPPLDGLGLQPTKAERFARVAALGLSFTPTVTAAAPDFLRTPQAYLDLVPGTRLIGFLDPVPTAQVSPRLPLRPIERELLAAKVQTALAEQRISPADCLVTFLKAYRIIYNGNIIVQRDGTFIAEFAAGPRSPSQQNVEIACRVTRDPFLGSFRYSSPDLSTRFAIHRLLSALPGSGEGRQRVYHPGYYEAALGVDAEGLVGITPIFYDYRDEELFIGGGGQWK